MSETAAKTVYDNGTWAIELRARNNHHEDEPDYKVWVTRHGKEIAKYSTKYKGYDHYKDNESLIPPEISGRARLAWDKLMENVGNDTDITEDLKTALQEFVVEAAE